MSSVGLPQPMQCWNLKTAPDLKAIITWRWQPLAQAVKSGYIEHRHDRYFCRSRNLDPLRLNGGYSFPAGHSTAQLLLRPLCACLSGQGGTHLSKRWCLAARARCSEHPCCPKSACRCWRSTGLLWAIRPHGSVDGGTPNGSSKGLRLDLFPNVFAFGCWDSIAIWRWRMVLVESKVKRWQELRYEQRSASSVETLRQDHWKRVRPRQQYGQRRKRIDRCWILCAVSRAMDEFAEGKTCRSNFVICPKMEIPVLLRNHQSTL